MMSRATQVRRPLAQPWPDSSKELQNILAEPSHEATVMQVKMCLRTKMVFSMSRVPPHTGGHIALGGDWGGEPAKAA